MSKEFKTIFCTLRPLKVYYKIPDSDNAMQNNIIALLYENYKLRILLACEPVRKLTDKENGMIVIERTEDAIELRYEGWSPEVELILKWCIAQIKEKQKVR